MPSFKGKYQIITGNAKGKEKMPKEKGKFQR